MSYSEANPNAENNPFTVYDGFSDPDLPAVEDLDEVTDIVELGPRRWTWEKEGDAGGGGRWSLYGDGEIAGITFKSMSPVHHNQEYIDDTEAEVKVTHFFDMQGLPQLSDK